MSYNIGAFILLATFVIMVLSLISLIIPIRSLGFKTRKRALLYGFLSFAGFMYGGALIGPSQEQTRATTQTVAMVQPPPASPAPPVPAVVAEPIALTTPDAPASAPAMPHKQQKFAEVMATINKMAASATNDMQRGGLLARRNKIICMLLADMKAEGWTGKIYKVGANGDGKGILEVEIAPDVYVMTWNNAFSDMFDKTLLEPGSAVFDQASALAAGQEVTLSGRFVPDTAGEAGACLKESSLTLSGKLNEPEYLFYFDRVQPK